MDDGLVERALSAIRQGKPLILPTDTVYGLCANAYSAAPVERLAALKGRPATQPIALVAADFEMLLECVPELRGKAATLARPLFPGPLTLILPNPGRRFRWLTGPTPDKIGIRIPELTGEAAAIVGGVCAIAATSANLTGGPDPRTVDEIPEELRAACEVVVDAGELPGTPSTVVDLTGPEPQILREGAMPASEVFDRLAAAAA